MPDLHYFSKLRAFLSGRRDSQSTRNRRAKWRTPAAQSATTFALEPLEARVLLAADLAAAVQAVQIVPEQEPATATVLVTNNGPDRVSNAPVAVHASQDTALDASDVSIGSGRVQGNLRAGEIQHATVNLNFSSLAPGSYHILGSVTDVEAGNPANNVGIGPRVLKDADGTVALFGLRGPGQVQLIQDGSQWDVRVTGTTDQSVLTLQTRGGNGRVTIDDLHVQGPLGAVVAPTMDLVGTLAIDGPVKAGILLGSGSGAMIAAPTIQGTTIQGVTVQGIAILGNWTDSTILIGAQLGADGQLGGTGANADTFGVGTIGRLFIGGRFINDVQSPSLAAALANDSGRPGDGLTNNATITGTASDQSGIATLRAGFGGIPSFDISSKVQGGAFTLTSSDLAAINGGALPDGSHTLTLLARDPNGIGRVTQVAFTLDTALPPLTLELAPASDTAPTGDNQTTEATVTLQGRTEANAVVDLVGLNKQTTADANGDFSFTDVSLTLGANTFTAQATDAAGNQRTESRTITRVTANQAPVANPDTKTTPQNTPLSFSATDLTANDTDPDGNTLTVTAVAATANSNGTVSLSNGTVTYTPASNFTGPASFEYTVSDGAGGTAIGVVNVTVTPVNQPPLARPIARPNPAEATTPDGSVITFDGSASSDPNGDPLSYSWSGPFGTLTGPIIQATVPLGAHPVTLRVTDPEGFTGTTTILVRVQDTIAPVANTDSKATPQNTALSFPTSELTSNDTDAATPPGSLVVTAVTSIANTHGTVALSNGIVTYTPDTGFSGPASFEYTVRDQAGNATAGIVNVTVIQGNQPPVLESIDGSPFPTEGDLTYATFVGSPLHIQLGASDPDAGQILTFSLVVAPAGAAIDPVTGLFTWTPSSPSPPGRDFSVTFMVTDNGSPPLSDSGTIGILVI